MKKHTYNVLALVEFRNSRQLADKSKKHSTHTHKVLIDSVLCVLFGNFL